MRMMDCFYEVLYQTVELIQSFNRGESPGYDEVRLQIDKAISERASHYTDGGYSEAQYRVALYAVVSFIDEAILLSPWEHKKEWKKEMLQVQHFQSFNAGEEFYEKLNGLNVFDPAEKDIREVYYYCLSLGFRGKYYSSDAQLFLNKLKSENQALLKSVEERNTVFEREKRYFPEAYTPGKEGTGIEIHVDYRPFAYGIPVLILLILFYILKIDIYEAANYLITTI